MCVIIYRKPDTAIPFEKLKSACIVNADGMGLVAFDRGKLELRKYFSEDGNDPEILAKFLEDTKDLHVYAHLRYRTKGTRDKDNVHPFGILKSKKHGMDLQFMHNGTLSDFGTDSVCDSRDFVKKFLTPLAEKLAKAIPPEDLIHDDTFKTILSKYAGRSSVFLLADNFGNHQIINYDEGKEFDGWWASNEYSFNRYHRDPLPNYSTTRRSHWERDSDWDPKRSSVQTEGKTIAVAPVPAARTDTRPPFNDEVPFNTEAANDKEKVKEVAKKPITTPTIPNRERFIDVANVNHLADVCGLSYEQIKDLVDEYPEEAALLIKDLIKELWDVDVEAAEDDVKEVA